MSYLLKKVSQLTLEKLHPLVNEIDIKGIYPEDFLHQLGSIGGFASICRENSSSGLLTQIKIIREIGIECACTSFIVWCQSVCAWYLHKSKHKKVRNKYLNSVLNGKILAGTGLSNIIKHLGAIEDSLLTAKKINGGYVINGTLPFVSNIGKNNIWAAVAQLNDNEYIMFITGGSLKGISLKKIAQFCALEGSSTLSINFKDVYINDEDILAYPDEFNNYINSIKPGFILLQIGIGLGISEGCLKIIQESNKSNANNINMFLNNGEEVIKKHLEKIFSQTKLLINLIDINQINILEVLKIRLEIAEFTLIAAQSAALHAGAKGYLIVSPAQRKLREAMFLAIVTPSIKHLRKDIALLSDFKFA